MLCVKISLYLKNKGNYNKIEKPFLDSFHKDGFKDRHEAAEFLRSIYWESDSYYPSNAVMFAMLSFDPDKVRLCRKLLIDFLTVKQWDERRNDKTYRLNKRITSHMQRPVK